MTPGSNGFLWGFLRGLSIRSAKLSPTRSQSTAANRARGNTDAVDSLRAGVVLNAHEGRARARPDRVLAAWGPTGARADGSVGGLWRSNRCHRRHGHWHRPLY